MKTLLLILPLAGAALFVWAGEPAKKDAPSAPVSGSATNNTPTSQARLSTDDTSSLEGVGDRVANAGTITAEPLGSVGKQFLQKINPFAPVEAQPSTPWLSRAPWRTASENGAARSEPIETRHEAHFGFVFAGL